MTGFTGNLNSQAVGKTQRRAPSEMPYGGTHDVSVLNRQILVIQQHFDHGSDLFWCPFVYGIEHPHRFG